MSVTDLKDVSRRVAGMQNDVTVFAASQQAAVDRMAAALGAFATAQGATLASVSSQVSSWRGGCWSVQA